MSEPPPLHSSALVSLARSLSGLGISITNGGPLSALDQSDSLPPVTGIELGPGLYFADGKHKVDYVLAYKYKKRRASKSRLSIASNGSMPFPLMGPRLDDGEFGECATTMEPEEQKLTEEEKVLMREEFEAQLAEAGLKLERDKERTHGIRFLRLHIPWTILSREAELQKIKVAVKKKCDLHKRSGIAGMWDRIIAKITTPFQPDIPDLEIQRDPRTRIRFKTLKHAFIRDKLHLYDIKSRETLFDNATRSRIVAEMISRITCTQTCQTTGIQSLLARGVYESAFPLHDGSFTRRGQRDQRNDRQILHEEWANYRVMYKYQPVDLIRKYFGEQIGLYFAWLGIYTQLLIPPSLLGIFVFLYGIITVDSNIPSEETCNERLNITMCPLCDGVCDYWQLSSVCSLARATYLFDNGATVLFAIFMSLWAACFLEHWKRRQTYLKHAWDLTSMQDDEEELRPEYESALQEKRDKIKTLTKKQVKSEETDGETDQMLISSQQEIESLEIEDHLCGYLINVSTFIFLIMVTVSVVVGVAVYRICMLSVWSMNPDPEAKASVRMTVTTTGIVLNMLVVLVLEEVYGAIAIWLTELEIPRTKEEFEERLIFKSFFLKSMNAFAPIFYVAFFKGRFSGRPGDYVYAFGDYRMEECAPPGCLIELCIQLSMIMLGKQLIQNNVFEVLIPKLKKMYRSFQEHKGNRKAAEEEENKFEGKRPKQQYHKDHTLEPYEGVTPEYMEMIIQFGFVSLFVASFPLAPAFALLNNVIEIRLDASKFVTEIRRPDAVRCKDIGIWYHILCGISKFAVITNAFVISFTSEFVPRMVYQYMYSVNGTLAGYTEHSLSHFNISNFAAGSAPTSTMVTSVSECRYKDYRDPPWAPEAYTFSKQYWAMLAAKLAFVIFFQNLAMFLSLVVAWIIPDVPRSLRDQLKKENMMLMEFLVNHDKEACPRPSPSSMTNINVIVEAPAEDWEENNILEEEEELRFGNDYIHPSDSDPDIVKSFAQAAEEQPDHTKWREKHSACVDFEANREQKQESEGKMELEQQEEEKKQKHTKCSAAETVDLDSLLTELDMTDESSLSSKAEPPHSTSKQQLQSEPLSPVDVPSKSGSAHSVHASRSLPDTAAGKPYTLMGPPPSRCSTLPSRHRGVQCYSLPQPSLSSSLSKLQLGPVSAPAQAPERPSKSPSSGPLQARVSNELFRLKGPPAQAPHSRGKGCCSTLPSRQRAPGQEEHHNRPSHSTSLSTLGERNTPV
ncbi:anoctamin-1-like isoform X2 [Eucyclogobius newberryi]|uniref:anoctamin-1-like isoform X2 n=1 Tax=Eucyclogobius newberryi TaxID=166745 RepID=UPI003B5B0035